jgi:hypothetical protein
VPGQQPLRLGNQPVGDAYGQQLSPTAIILAPANRLLYRAGDAITFSGSGSDPENGSFSWTIVFHHLDHTHPFLGPVTNITSGTLVIPASGETSVSVFYRIHLTVTDSAGAQNSTYVDVLPEVATLTLASDPIGLQLTLVQSAALNRARHGHYGIRIWIRILVA